MASLLRTTTWGASALLHAALALSLVSFDAGGRAYDTGDGGDMFNIDHGIAIEGLSQSGLPSEVIETARDTPAETQATAAAQPQPSEPPPPEEIPVTEPPPELVEESEVITAKAEVVEEQEILRETPPEVVKPQVVAAAEPVPEAVVVEEKSAAKKQTGGDPTVRMAYLGKLRSRIEAKKVNPHSRDAGTVVVRFTVDAKGKLVSREVATSSGSKRLDEAALAAVERASPYPPFPEGLGAPTIDVDVPFRFITR